MPLDERHVHIYISIYVYVFIYIHYNRFWCAISVNYLILIRDVFPFLIKIVLLFDWYIYSAYLVCKQRFLYFKAQFLGTLVLLFSTIILHLFAYSGK